MGRAPIVMGAERAELRARMRQAYDGGLTVRQVAERFARSYGTTNKMLREAGTTLRSRGGARTKGPAA